MTDREAMFEMVAANRLSLCDRLELLSTDQWEVASLCAGWRVRDVVGHLVSLQAVPTWRFVIGVVGMRGFHRRADRFAREWGARPPSELVGRYRELAGSRRVPPVMGPIAPLTDVVVHGLDIGRPLGQEPTHGDEAVRTVLDALAGGLPGFTPRRLVRGLSFEATDLDWRVGEGPTVRGAVADLVLALNARSADSWTLSGDGAPILSERLTA